MADPYAIHYANLSRGVLCPCLPALGRADAELEAWRLGREAMRREALAAIDGLPMPPRVGGFVVDYAARTRVVDAAPAHDPMRREMRRKS